MATAREENPYEGGGFGKFRKRPFRRAQTTPYDRPPTALRNPSSRNNNNGWFSKLVDPAQRLIASSAHKLFSSVFRKRLPPPPPPPPSAETVQEAGDNHQEAAASVANESSGKPHGAVGDSEVQINYSDGGGLTELEKLLKQKTFTRSEIDRLTALMHSRTVDSPVGEEEKRPEVVPSDPMLLREQKEEYSKTPALENGIENRLVSIPYVTSSAPIDGVASPAELAKAYMGSRPSKVSPSIHGLQSAPKEESTLLKGQHFTQKSPIMSIVPRATPIGRVHENGFINPRSRGRSAIYSMAQTPYARVYPASTLKGVGSAVQGEPSSSAQYALDRDMLSGSNQGALKRRSSVLDNDIGSVGPIRRIRQKPNLLYSKGLTLPHSSSPIARSGAGIDAAQQPSSSMKKAISLGEVKHSPVKFSTENVDDTIPSTSFPPLPSKSSEMASKILLQLDKLASPKEKSSAFRIPTMNNKSPTQLSTSMLQGQALRSMEVVDSSKFLDGLQDKELDGTHGNFPASSQKLTSQIDNVENDPLKLVAPTDGLVLVVTESDPAVPRKQVTSIAKSGDSSLTKPVSYSPPKKRAFHMSAHEDYPEMEDDAYPNGDVSPFTSGKQTIVSTAVAEKTTCGTENTVKEMPPGSSVTMLSKSCTVGGEPLGTADGSKADENVNAPNSIPSSIPDPTFKPAVSAVTEATHTILGPNKLGSPNGSVANPNLFNFGNKVVPLPETTAADVPSKESTKSGPIFGLKKADSSNEPSANVPVVNFGINKNVDSVPRVPFNFSSSVGGESSGFKFGSSDSKPSSISSTTIASAADSRPEVLESVNADAKTSMVPGFSARLSEPAVPSAASTLLTTSPRNISTFGNSSNQNNGPVASFTSFSSPVLPMVTNNFSSPNIFSSSSLATSSSSIDATTASTSTSMTTSAPVVIASSNSSSSTRVMASSSPTTSFFKFGSTPLSSTSLPVSSTSGSEPVETKGRQDAGIGNQGGTFGSSSAAVGSTGSGIFGFSSSSMTTVNSQSQGSSVFGATSGSVLGSSAPPATSDFVTSIQSQPVGFGSSGSSLSFGLIGNTAFSSGSSLFPSSSPATNIFNSGTTFGQRTPSSSAEDNPVSSSSGTSSTLFGPSSWQPSKSPLGSSFSSSSSSTSGFSFGTSAPSVASTGSSMMFGSSTGASSAPQFSFTSAASLAPQFSFTSAASTTTNMQPTFGSPNPLFTFGSASAVNNDQMGMEDSMAEDTVQATPPAAPVFGQQPAQPQSNFVFGASASTPTLTGASSFQFSSQQNFAQQNPSPFQSSGSLEFGAGGGSFSLGTGGDNKSVRRYVKVTRKPRKK